MPRLAPAWVACGIDGGASGGIAGILRWPDGRITEAVIPCDTRDSLAVRDALKTLVPWKGMSVLVGIERAQPFPGRGVKTLWAVAQGYFTALAVVKMRRMAHLLVPSQSWTKVALSGYKKPKRSSATSKKRHVEYKAHKELLVTACNARWPRALDGVKKGSQSGCCDALWIAHFVARTHFLGRENDAVVRRSAARVGRSQKETP